MIGLNPVISWSLIVMCIHLSFFNGILMCIVAINGLNPLISQLLIGIHLSFFCIVSVVYIEYPWYK